MSEARAQRGTSGKNWIFGVLFGLILVLALFPPVYIWAGKQHGIFLGLPFSVVYMIGLTVLVTVVCYVLYRVELARGEVD